MFVDAKFSNNLEQSIALKTLANMGIPVPMPVAVDTQDKLGVTVVRRKGVFAKRGEDESLMAYETRLTEARAIRAEKARWKYAAKKSAHFERALHVSMLHGTDKEESVLRSILPKDINVKIDTLTGERKTVINRTAQSIADSLMCRNWRGESKRQGKFTYLNYRKLLAKARMYESMLPMERSKSDLYLLTVDKYKGGAGVAGVQWESTFLAIDRAINVFTRQQDAPFWIQDVGEIRYKDKESGEKRVFKQYYTMAPRTRCKGWIDPQAVYPLGAMKSVPTPAPTPCTALKMFSRVWFTQEGATYTPYTPHTS